MSGSILLGNPSTIEAKDLSGLKAEGKRGDLNEALERLRGKNAFAILLSDGNLKWEEEVRRSSAPCSSRWGSQRLQGCPHQSVKAPAIAFRGREVPIDVTVKSYGYTGLTLPVVLKEGNKVLAAKNVRISKTLLR